MARTTGTKTRAEMLKMGLNTMPPEKAREYQSLGGRISQTRRRQKKLMLEMAADILELELRNKSEIEQVLKDGGLDDQDINYAAAILIVQVLKALRGDTRAAEFIRDTSGQKPTNGLNVGNLDSKPIVQLDLEALNEEKLREMLEKPIGTKEENDEP